MLAVNSNHIFTISIQIYVPNLRKKCYTDNVDELSELERFISILVERSIELSKKLGKGNKIMENYINEAAIASGDEILLEAYDKEWALKDLGRRDGYKEGLDEGISLGIEKNKIEIVKNMLDKNLDINLITEITGLSIEEITKIKNS